jgi:nucleotide-binding universal stress UspA family protein
MAAGSDGPLLICYDGSDGAKHAIRTAGNLFGATRALILTVWQPTVGLGGFAWSGAMAPMVDFVQLDRTATEGAGRVANDGARIARDAGLEAEPMAVAATEAVWRTIVELADSEDATAIVMGSRGLTGVRSVLLGSVSTAVLHHAVQPTLVVHHPGAHASSTD